MIELTQQAAEYAQKLLDKKGIKAPPGGIRFFIKAGGCSGLQYCFKLEKSDARFDIIMILYGVRVLIDPKSMKLMNNAKIDHTNNLTDPPFIFINPNAKSTCGCNISFELK